MKSLTLVLLLVFIGIAVAAPFPKWQKGKGTKKMMLLKKIKQEGGKPEAGGEKPEKPEAGGEKPEKPEEGGEKNRKARKARSTFSC